MNRIRLLLRRPSAELVFEAKLSLPPFALLVVEGLVLLFFFAFLSDLLRFFLSLSSSLFDRSLSRTTSDSETMTEQDEQYQHVNPPSNHVHREQNNNRSQPSL